MQLCDDYPELGFKLMKNLVADSGLQNPQYRFNHSSIPTDVIAKNQGRDFVETIICD